MPVALQIIYPWISKPDEEPPDPAEFGKGAKQKVKYGKAR